MDYSRIAPYYQFLSRIVFGNSLIDAQNRVLKGIAADKRVLLAGGGDGEVLKKLNFEFHLDFLEPSGKMIALAKKKTKRPVHWLQQDLFLYHPAEPYDYIYLPFLVDNFTQEQMEDLASRLRKWLKPSGEVIITDYPENPVGWQKWLLKTMYFFFGLVAGVKVKKMPPVQVVMERNGFVLSGLETGFNGFLETKRWRVLDRAN